MIIVNNYICFTYSYMNFYCLVYLHFRFLLLSILISLEFKYRNQFFSSSTFTRIGILFCFVFICRLLIPLFTTQSEFDVEYPCISSVWKPRYKQHKDDFIRKSTRTDEQVHAIYFPSRISKFNLENNVCLCWVFLGKWTATECSKQNKTKMRW